MDCPAEKTLDDLMLQGTDEPLSERHLIASLRAPGTTQTSAEILRGAVARRATLGRLLYWSDYSG